MGSERNHSLLVSAASIYPIKSCGVVSLKKMTVNEFGPLWDRHWMLVDENGRFISQRTHPILSQVKVTEKNLLAGCFVLSFPGQEDVEVSPLNEGELLPVKIWRDQLQAFKAHSFLNDWFSEAIGQKCFLVENSFNKTHRKVKEKYGDHFVQFADGFPLLLIGTASLDFLNQKLNSSISMLRFRPNLVVKTERPHQEDEWTEIEINGLQFSLVKKCGRCNMVNVDPQSGETDPEVLKTLLSYRKQGANINFGQNLIHQGHGEVGVGDAVKVI